MAENQTNRDRISESFEIQDNRYPIRPVIKTRDGNIKYEWYFNPADMMIARKMDELQKLMDRPTTDFKEFAELIEKISELIDNIFNENVSGIILRHCDTEYTFLFKIVEKITEGYNDFLAKAESASKKREAEARKEAVIAAKAEASAFIANKA